MKYIVILSMFVIISCGLNKRGVDLEGKGVALYMIDRIDSLNNYYLVYAKNQDSIYKIVIGKDLSKKCKQTILLKEKYFLSLKSKRELAPIINGVKIAPFNVDCFVFDEETTICIEQDIGIYDLYFTDDIVGLCYVRK